MTKCIIIFPCCNFLFFTGPLKIQRLSRRGKMLQKMKDLTDSPRTLHMIPRITLKVHHQCCHLPVTNAVRCHIIHLFV